MAELIKVIKERENSAKAKKSGLKVEDFIFGEGDQFKYELHSLPEAGTASIGTSGLLAAWNAAVYVAQVDDIRTEQAIKEGSFVNHVEATNPSPNPSPFFPCLDSAGHFRITGSTQQIWSVVVHE